MIICWKQHVLTTLKRTDRVTDTKAAELCINWDIIGLHHCCLKTHFWEPDFKKSSLRASNCFTRFDPPPLYLIQTPVTKTRWSVNAAKHAYVTSAWTSDAWFAASPPSPKTSKGIWRFLFSPSKHKCCFVIALVSVKRVEQRHETHFLSDLQPYQTNSSHLHTDSSRGGWGAGGGKRRMDYGSLSAELQLMLPRAITGRFTLQLRKTHSGNQPRQEASSPTAAFLTAVTETRMNMNYSSTNSSFLNLSQDWSNPTQFHTFPARRSEGFRRRLKKKKQ